MNKLKEFLKKQAEEQRSTADDRVEVQREWVEALDRLMDRLAGWLRETDTEGVLKIEPTSHRISERRIGIYEARGLRISLGSREIRVEPIARDAFGSFVGDNLGTSIRGGRVDMTNYEIKYILYRRTDGDRDEWVMVDDRDYRAQPLDRDHFEAAIQGMLE